MELHGGHKKSLNCVSCSHLIKYSNDLTRRSHAAPGMFDEEIARTRVYVQGNLFQCHSGIKVQLQEHQSPPAAVIRQILALIIRPMRAAGS